MRCLWALAVVGTLAALDVGEADLQYAGTSTCTKARHAKVLNCDLHGPQSQMCSESTRLVETSCGGDPGPHVTGVAPSVTEDVLRLCQDAARSSLSGDSVSTPLPAEQASIDDTTMAQ